MTRSRAALALLPLTLALALMSPAHAAHKVAPADAVSAGVGVPATSSKGKLKTPCSLPKIAGLGAAAWAQGTGVGSPWAWQGVATKSPRRVYTKVFKALDKCPGLGLFTTDWDSDGLEEKTVMLTGTIDDRYVTVLVFLHGDLVTVVGADSGKPYRQERDLLVRIMQAQGVTLTPIPGT